MTFQRTAVPRPSANDLFDLNAYGTDVPKDLIAQYPCPDRDRARLMVLDRGAQTIRHGVFADIEQYLAPKTVFVVNNSKVSPARLLGRRAATGGEVEVFLLNQLSDGNSFEALLKPLKKIREGERVDFGFGISAFLTDKEKRIVRFNVKNVIRRLKDVGHVPLPPYIKRADEPLDRDYYQNVYAKRPGSVASPKIGRAS